MGFKVDTSFLKYVTMGALGTKKVLDQMTQAGLRPIELERYSCCNKIWSTKVKRLRLPDLLCVSTGIRVEVRTKSDLEIKMSDAPQNDERRWFSGLRQQDIIAFIFCDSSNGDFRVSDEAELFTVSSLSDTEAHSKLGPPKSASEGAERDRTWPSTVAKCDGTVLQVTDTTISTLLTNGRRQAYQLKEKNSYVDAGTNFRGNSQFIAGMPTEKITFSAFRTTNWNPRADLRSENSIDRYSAVKALGYTGNNADITELIAIAQNEGEPRVALESAGAAARLGSPEALNLIVNYIDNPPENYLRMEAVFILTELAENDTFRTTISNHLLDVALNDNYRNDEVRQAAIWGLGKAGCKDNTSLLNFLGSESDDEVTHAINAFESDCDNIHIDSLISILGDGHSSIKRKCSAGYILSNVISAARVIPRLMDVLQHTDANTTKWIISILGQISPSEANPLLTDPHIVEMVKPIQLLSPEMNWTKCEVNLGAISFIKKQNIY